MISIKELIFNLPNKEEFFLVHKPFQQDVESVKVYTNSFDDNLITISVKSKFKNKHNRENFVLEYDLYEEHHIHGANIADAILRKFKYDESKIELVKKCILNHRGSTNNRRLSKEEQIIADADAISHFDSVPSLLYLAYKQKNMSIEEGKEFVKSKLERSFNKLSDDSKTFYEEKFKNVMKIL